MPLEKLPTLPLVFSAFSPGDGYVSTIWGSRLLPAQKSDELIVAADGSGHFITIAEAIAFLGGGAATIRVKDGDYLQTVALDLTAGTTIIGSGYGTKIYTTSNITIFTGTGLRVQIHNARLYGSSAGASQRGINFSGNQCTIKNCWIHNFGDYGVRIDGDECVIQGNRILDCDDDCLVLDSNHDRCVVFGNIIDNSGQRGIDAQSGIGDSIVGNMITDHGEDGIRLVSCIQFLISANYCFSNGDNNNNGHGIEIDGASNDNSIMNNICHSNDGWGISIDDATCNKNIIIGNSCLNNEDGAIQDNGTNTHPNGASGTNNLALDDLNIIA